MEQRRGLFARTMLWIGSVLVGLVLFGSVVWGAFALFYQGPGSEPVRYLLVALWLMIALGCAYLGLQGRVWFALITYAVCFAILLAWWHTILPRNDRIWAPELSEMTRGVIEGDTATLYNVRNFDWVTETEFTPRWETRQYDLSKLSSVDMLLSYWGSEAIAHTLVSFGFSTGEFVTFSVEIRKEKHESFSEIGGFFKQFENSVVAADERDIVRLRTNVRKEDVYLYRINMPPAAMRSLFQAYVEEANALIDKPEFYNTVTANCTTIVYHMVARIIPGLPMDFRLLLSGYLPDYIARVGGLMEGYTVSDLKAAGRIGPRALAADQALDFSSRIRQGIPGYEGLSAPFVNN